MNTQCKRPYDSDIRFEGNNRVMSNELISTQLGRRKISLPARSAVIGELPPPRARPLPIYPRIDRTFKACWEYNLTNEEYHNRRETTSSTGLRKILVSPATFYESLVVAEEEQLDPDSVVKVGTKSMRLGTLVHECILEPAKFLQKFVLMPEFVGNTLDGRPSTKSAEAKKKKEDWLKALPPGVNVCDEDTFHNVIGMVKAILDHPEARSIFEREADGTLSKGLAEVSGFYADPETGILLRIRPDFARFDVGVCAEVKTAQSADRRKFSNKIWDFRYDVQLAMQCEGIKIITGQEVDLPTFIAVESKPPYEVGVYTASPEMMAMGHKSMRRAITLLAECLASNKWPRRQASIENISFANYILAQEELIHG